MELVKTPPIPIKCFGCGIEIKAEVLPQSPDGNYWCGDECRRRYCKVEIKAKASCKQEYDPSKHCLICQAEGKVTVATWCSATGIRLYCASHAATGTVLIRPKVRALQIKVDHRSMADQLKPPVLAVDLAVGDAEATTYVEFTERTCPGCGRVHE